LKRRIKKEKEPRTTPGGEQAPVLHPQQHDRVGVLILILDIPFVQSDLLRFRFLPHVILTVYAGVYL
jgi:hypothetical protein